jgi:aminoglycoside phosphotransferase
VPRVLNHSHDGKALHIVMTEIPGVPAHRVPADKRGQAVEAIACALQEMQRVTITKAPLKKSPAEDVPVIEELIEQGRLDTAGFAAAAGQSPQAVLEQLRQMLSTRPIGGADTLSHGDFCLPNILLGPSGAVTGVIDWGLARRASRFRDCVVLEGSLLRNYGSDYIDRFYDAYGARPDADERRLFRMIDLFFEYQRPETVRSRPQP